MTAGTDDALAELGNALATVAKLSRRPDVLTVIGASQAQELSTVAVGFRQRFPHHWPSTQMELTLPGQGTFLDASLASTPIKGM